MLVFPEAFERFPKKALTNVFKKHLFKSTQDEYNDIHVSSSIRKIFEMTEGKGYQRQGWQKSKAEDNIRKIEDGFFEMHTAFHNLPEPLRDHLSSEVFDNLRKYHPIISPSLMEGPLPEETRRKMSFSHLIMLLVVSFYGMGGRDTKEGNVMHSCRNQNKPPKDIYERKSNVALMKIGIVDEVRKAWENCKKQKAPKTIPDQGSDFGDFLEEVFKVLKIKTNPRAAIDAWRKEELQDSIAKIQKTATN